MAHKHYIQLPHQYLSYSQMSLWLSDPKRYAGLYFDGRDELRVSNSGQKYGKEVADALEQGRETGDILTDAALLLLPKYDIADQQIDTEIKTKNGWLKLVAKPDTLDSKSFAFREYKTGKNPWTQKKADAHLQMIFYAVVIWQKYGVRLQNAHLDWIETADTLGGIRPTGRVETFEVLFRPEQYLDTLAKMVQVAKEIEIAWAGHITNPELTTF